MTRSEGNCANMKYKLSIPNLKGRKDMLFIACKFHQNVILKGALLACCSLNNKKSCPLKTNQ